MRSSSSSSGVPGPPGSLDGDYFIQQDSNTISGTDDEEVAECGSRKVVPPVKLVERVVKVSPAWSKHVKGSKEHYYSSGQDQTSEFYGPLCSQLTAKPVCLSEFRRCVRVEVDVLGCPS